MGVDLTSTDPSQDFPDTSAAPVGALIDAAPPEDLVVASVQGPEAHPARHEYPSLYDTRSTTVLAILIAIAIVGGVQYGVARIFATSKTEHHALTHFVTAMVGLVMGVYVCDMLIAGPDTELLGEQERITILAFIKDTCLMVFAYYFGTRAIPPSDSIDQTKS